MFYGAPRALTPAGREVGAVRALMRSLTSLLREGVTHLGCAFDHVIESFRNELYAGYKTGEGIEAALRSQFAPAERAVEALGVVVWPMVAFEADDALATAAQRWRDDPAVEQVRLCSPDKDLAQCVVGQRVVLYDRRRKSVLDEPGVTQKYGVPPSAIADFLALAGDSADGVPGLPGWGAKSASALLRRYGSIDEIPADHRSWDVTVRGAERLAGALRGGRAELDVYRQLTRLRRDVPLPQRAVGELRWRGGTPGLRALCEEVGVPALLDILADLKRGSV